MIWIEKNESINYRFDRSGMRIKSHQDVNKCIRNEVVLYAKWLRTQYAFPIRVPVYLHHKTALVTVDGERASAIFFEPYDYDVEPYIKIADGTLSSECTAKNIIIANVLFDLTHELTHYFQWLSHTNMTIRGRERQATNYARRILWEYMMGRYADLYSQITWTIPDCQDAYCQIKPISRDVQGRTLFECRFIPKAYDAEDFTAIAISQWSENGNVYYYPEISYKLFAKTEGISYEEISKLKTENMWGKPLNLANCQFGRIRHFEE
ncbi:MAG: hypothetical protein IKZ82_01265 [Clostridia bacterium]|nr:hypothetical protein [Clostridia bacterium]